MADLSTVLRCETCGTELAGEANACPVCSRREGRTEEAEASGGEGVASPAEQEEVAECAEATAEGALWIRVCGALVYLGVGAYCAYGAYSLLRGREGAEGEGKVRDWAFGVMAIGLVAIAIVGIKESLFPSEWKEE